MSKILDRVLDSMADRIARRVAAHNTVSRLQYRPGDLYVAVKTDEARAAHRKRDGDARA